MNEIFCKQGSILSNIDYGTTNVNMFKDFFLH